MLDPEVVVEMAGEVLVDDELARPALAGRPRTGLATGGFRGFREVALAAIVVERQGYRTPCIILVRRPEKASISTPMTTPNRPTMPNRLGSDKVS